MHAYMQILPCAHSVCSCRPKLAILDECTNATSVDVEHRLYARSAELGITVITITQRPALTRLHQAELKLLDGRGHWQLCSLRHSGGAQ